MKIQSSKDYSQFKMDPTNRDVTNIAKLQKSMKKHGFLPAYPMHCVKNCTGFIIKDGQHRFEAAKAEGIPVCFVVCDDDSISVSEINSAQRAWSLRDFVTSHANQGKSDYQFLKNFSETHALPLSVCAAMLAGHQAATCNLQETIRSGSFAVKDSETAEVVAGIVSEARRQHFESNRYFVDALSKCVKVKEFKATHLIEKIRKFPQLLTPQANSDAFLGMVEYIYNHFAGSGHSIPLKFLANEAAKKRNPSVKKLAK